jgi:hypothetical protein
VTGDRAGDDVNADGPFKDALTPTPEQMARPPILRGGLPENPITKRRRKEAEHG